MKKLIILLLLLIPIKLNAQEIVSRTELVYYSDPTKIEIIKDLSLWKVSGDSLNPFIQPKDTTNFYGSWNELSNRKDRIDLSIVVWEIDKKHGRPSIPGYVCLNFASQLYINFRGYDKELPLISGFQNLGEFRYEEKYNGRFNLPLYLVIVTKESIEGFALNSILVGDSPLEFNDWLFIDDMYNKTVKNIDEWHSHIDADVTIYRIDEIFSYGYLRTSLVKFYIDGNKNVELVEYSPNLILNRPIIDEVTNDVDLVKIPERFSLHQNYPNPFNPITNIRYILLKDSFVNLTIYNSLGQKIKTLVNERQASGIYFVQWDGKGFASGIYFCVLKTKDFISTKKMVLIKR